MAEIAFGVELSASRDRNMAILQRNLQSLNVWPFDERAAFSYGAIAAELRKIGRPMQTMDMMLAAVSLNRLSPANQSRIPRLTSAQRSRKLITYLSDKRS